MIENYDKIKQNVLIIGGFEDTPKLDLQIQTLIDECLAYCYRDDVPELMELPLSDVITNEIKKRGLLGLEGDMSVSYNSGVSGKNFYNGKLERFKLIRSLDV